MSMSDLCVFYVCLFLIVDLLLVRHCSESSLWCLAQAIEVFCSA